MTQTINLEFDGIASTSLDVESDLSADALTARILAVPGVDAALRAAIADVIRPIYARDGEIGQELLNAAATAFLNEGDEGLLAWADKVVDADGLEFRRLDEVKDTDVYKDIADVVGRAVTEYTGADADGDELLDEPLTALVGDIAGQADSSRPVDLIGRHDEVMVCYVPAYHFGFEDDAIFGERKSLRPRDVEVDHTAEGPRLPKGYLAYLRMVNADPVALREHLAACDSAADRAEDEHSGRAEAWRKADWGFDPSRPSLHDAATVLTVLENTSDCAVATLTMRVNLRALIAHDFAAPTLITPRLKGKPYAGFLNFVHGAGHEEPVRDPVTVPAGREQWKSAETDHYSHDGIFGVVASAYAVDLASTP